MLAIALGYGVRGTDRFADVGPRWLEARPTLAAGELVGQNAAGLITIREEKYQYTQASVSLQKLGGRRRVREGAQVEHDQARVPASGGEEDGSRVPCIHADLADHLGPNLAHDAVVLLVLLGLVSHYILL